MNYRSSWLSILFIAVLATTTTFAYCMASGYLAMIWSILTTEPSYAPRLTVVTIKPLGDNPETLLWHWHSMAFASLLLNGLWSVRRLRASGGDPGTIGAPIATHVSWLVFAFFLHLTGFAASTVDVVYVLK
jgi:hypothetical protein